MRHYGEPKPDWRDAGRGGPAVARVVEYCWRMPALQIPHEPYSAHGDEVVVTYRPWHRDHTD